MEHWYNSGKVDRARVDVSYQKRAAGSTITSLLSGSGTWTAIPNLGVDAPSTATVIASRDGNSISNRRVKQATLSDINLAPGEEIMIRWSYLLNNTTNGNGLSIDDVTISAFTNVFYSKTAGNIELATNWSSTPDGTGALPGNFSFSLPNATYYVQGNTITSGSNASSRINGTNAGVWTVNGANSRVVIGLPGATTPTRLYLFNDDNIVGKVDVSSNAALAIQQPNYSFTLGQLDNTSTVEYYTSSSAMNIAPLAYGNLKLTAAGNKVLTGNTLVNGTLTFATGPDLFLGDYNLTIQRGGGISGTTSSSYIVTNGIGRLSQTVSNSGADVLFPIGSSATSYTPALLQQPNSTTARNEDVFSVRVIDGLFRRYDADGNGVAGTEVLAANVKKTWLVDEEVTGNSDVKMTLQWNTADEVSTGDDQTRFDRTKAYIGHFINRPNLPPTYDKAVV
ncbi:hypothetical protein [Hymenobacter psychrotolerans]|nr:hypothetical protein [Hymenobacter psychrotolerans]